MKTARLVVLVAALIGLCLLTLRGQPRPQPASAVIQLPPQPQPLAQTQSAITASTATPAPPLPGKPAPPSPSSSPPPAPTADAQLPPVPQVQIATATPHEVPPSAVTERPPRPLDLRDEDLPIPDTSPSYRSLAPQYRPIPAYAPARPSMFSGTARVTGATSLVVNGTPVELYGIERPRQGDLCDGSDCTAAAKQALQARVADGARISCRLARASLGVVVFATCTDAQGTDLGGLLAGEGLARANARQSYAYLGAEHVARDLRKGLWARH
jgi:endonuclease YncB( thermonuclease family)